MTPGSFGRRKIRRGRPAPAGFTLVELLVVITIIGILIGLLLPAVQAAREAGRRTVCKNNVTQLVKACLGHDARQRHLPSGGWGSGWVGEPMRGFGKEQPGGWIYNVLPFMEHADLHDLGKGGNQADIQERLEFPLEILYCPSRRRPQSYTYVGDGYFNESGLMPGMVGRSDYAACAGNRAQSDECEWSGPDSFDEAKRMSDDDWNRMPGGSAHASGVIYRRSKVKYGSIRDGESFTYLLGEKYIASAWYETNNADGDNDSWSVGYDFDVIRWTNASRDYRPRRDTDPSDTASFSDRCFGGAHSTGFHMGFCGGSVRIMRYGIDNQVHASLGHKADRGPADLTFLD